MSVKNCFKNSSNKAMKSSFDKKVKAGIPEEEAALAVVKEYGADIQARLAKIKGVDVADTVLFDGVVNTETKKSTVTTQQQAVKIVSREKEVDPGIKGLRNRVIDLFTRALKDPKYFEETMTSIDNDTFKEGTLVMLDKVQAEDMDLWDPVKAIETRFSYRSGGEGVAQAANSLSDHILTQGKELSAVFNQGSWGNAYMDAQYSERLSNADMRKLFKVINERRAALKLDLMSKEEAEARLRQVPISATLSELINAFVDIANEDAFVTRGNWGNITNGYGMMMIRQGIHPHKVSAFIRQPAFVELVNAITNKEGVIDNTSSYEIEDEIFAKWKGLALDAGVDISFTTRATEGVLSSLQFDEMLDSAISQTADTPAAIRNQLIVLKNYIEAKNAIKKYNAFVTTTKNDAKGAGRDVQDMFVRVNRFSDSFFYDQPKKGQVGYGLKNVYQKFYDGKSTNTLSYTMYENTVGVMNKLMADNPIMFDGTGPAVFNNFNKIAAENDSDIRVTNLAKAEWLFNEFAAYKMASYAPISMEDTKEDTDAYMKEIIDLKATRKYEILNKLLINKKVIEGEVTVKEGTTLDSILSGEEFEDIADSTTEYELKLERVTQKDKEIKDSLTDSWRLLLRDNRALGDFLVRQSYRQSNFLPGPNQFYSLIPYEWWLDGRQGFNYIDHVYADAALPTDDFVSQAVRRSNSNDFFKSIKAAKVKNYYITNLDDDNSRMGMIGSGTMEMARAPKYAKNGDVPLKLLGVVTVLTRGDKKVEGRSRAIYQELKQVPELEASYEGNLGALLDRIDPNGEELSTSIGFKQAVKDMYPTKENEKLIIKDLNDLNMKIGGESFFRSPGVMVNLAATKELKEGGNQDGATIEQMCGT